MSTQSEQALENKLIAQLVTLGWDRVTITDEDVVKYDPRHVIINCVH